MMQFMRTSVLQMLAAGLHLLISGMHMSLRIFTINLFSFIWHHRGRP